MIYFISDLHLEESRPDITGAFLHFMDSIEESASQLYILGDLFESWIGDDENTPLQAQIKKRLKQFSNSGKALFFMHGNRDFLIGEQFSKETGATILPDPSIIRLGKQDVLLMHGDSLCTADKGYIKFRAMIRNPDFLDTFLKRPLEERHTTARQLREMSQASNQHKNMEIMDVTIEEVVREMAAHKVNIMIHGHTHRPMIHDLHVGGLPAKRYVLGDWDKKIWSIKTDGLAPLKLELKAVSFRNDAE